jgi:hypothetical protein
VRLRVPDHDRVDCLVAVAPASELETEVHDIRLVPSEARVELAQGYAPMLRCLNYCITSSNRSRLMSTKSLRAL